MIIFFHFFFLHSRREIAELGGERRHRSHRTTLWGESTGASHIRLRLRLTFDTAWISSSFCSQRGLEKGELFSPLCIRKGMRLELSLLSVPVMDLKRTTFLHCVKKGTMIEPWIWCSTMHKVTRTTPSVKSTLRSEVLSTGCFINPKSPSLWTVKG